MEVMSYSSVREYSSFNCRHGCHKLSREIEVGPRPLPALAIRSLLQSFTPVVTIRMGFIVRGFLRMSIVVALACRRMLIASICTLVATIRVLN
jgi:hypothetical protein